MCHPAVNGPSRLPVPRVVNQMPVTSLLLHVPLAMESECLNLDEFSSVF